MARWALVLFLISASLFAMRPFIIRQLLARGSSYSRWGRYGDAVRVDKKAVFISKKNADAWDALGHSYENQGNLEQAVHAYNEAIKVDPKNRDAYFSRGEILFSRKKYKEAYFYFEQVRSFGPEKREARVPDAFSYYISSLRLLITCYDELKEPGKKEGAQKELKQYFLDRLNKGRAQ